jgi:hypothetical protein
MRQDGGIGKHDGFVTIEMFDGSEQEFALSFDR